ncbi:unnamed protein product [Pieris brassicae]|uniref:Uncharacterized protein n=1 Tax=Pieris brassicae TaxID=7116 RepID=A0A9P0TVM8_PIEBR|nr:unnamed protein product [Pieris brassicae]
MVVTATLKSAGCDPSEFNINRSTIRRQYVKNRKAVTESLKSEKLTIHWDEELVSFAFFDDEVSVQEKKKVVKALKHS